MIIILILMLTVTASATVINVPAQYPTIQGALNSVNEHDTILVSDGLFFENLKFPPINLTLASQFLMDGDTSHINNTIINGRRYTNRDSASVIFMSGGQDSSTCIVGFTLTGGQGTLDSTYHPGYDRYFGGGCALYQSAPLIRSNHINSNKADYGSGIYLGEGTSAIIRDNEFTTDSSLIANGTIKGEYCSAQITGNYIHDNYAYAAAGVYFIHAGTVVIANNIIDNNRAFTWTAGAFETGDSIIISNNIISDQTILDPSNGAGSGILITNAHVIVENNQFLHNQGGYSFAALCLLGSCSGIISGNLFQDNYSLHAAAINIWQGTITIMNNQIINNYDAIGEAIFIGLDAHITMRHNTITGNSNGLATHSSAIKMYLNTPVEVDSNNIHGNQGIAIMHQYGSQFSIDAQNNWWGDPSGPYHPTLNPQGQGDTVGVGVLFDPWLTQPVGVIPVLRSSSPLHFELLSPYPNPSNASTIIRYRVQSAGNVSLKVYDLTGRMTGELFYGFQLPGTYSFTWDASQKASGVYVVRLQASGSGTTQTTMAKKAVIVK